MLRLALPQLGDTSSHGAPAGQRVLDMSAALSVMDVSPCSDRSRGAATRGARRGRPMAEPFRGCALLSGQWLHLLALLFSFCNSGQYLPLRTPVPISSSDTETPCNGLASPVPVLVLVSAGLVLSPVERAANIHPAGRQQDTGQLSGMTD